MTSVARADGGYQVATDRGEWHCRSVVLASGACNIPTLPKVAEAVPSSIATFTALDYRKGESFLSLWMAVYGRILAKMFLRH